MLIRRLLKVWSVPNPGTFGPVPRKLGRARNCDVLAKKNLAASELRPERRTSVLALNWSSWKLDGDEVEYNPVVCGVGIRNWPLDSFVLSSASEAELIEESLYVDSRVAADRSSVSCGSTRTVEEMLLIMDAALCSRAPW